MPGPLGRVVRCPGTARRAAGPRTDAVVFRSRSSLLVELGGVTGSPRKAKQALERASQRVGVSRKESLALPDLLLIAQALAAEGGPVQEWAEALAGDLLDNGAAAEQDEAA